LRERRGFGLFALLAENCGEVIQLVARDLQPLRHIRAIKVVQLDRAVCAIDRMEDGGELFNGATE
jgi:hypothetical protein